MTTVESGAAVIGDRIAVRRDSGFQRGDNNCFVYDHALIIRKQRQIQVQLLSKLGFKQVKLRDSCVKGAVRSDTLSLSAQALPCSLTPQCPRVLLGHWELEGATRSALVNPEVRHPG